MSTKAWAASGRRPSVRPPGSRTPRPLGSWGAALERARESWDGLTGSSRLGSGDYSEFAAASILATALGLWSDTAAAMGEPPPED